MIQRPRAWMVVLLVQLASSVGVRAADSLDELVEKTRTARAKRLALPTNRGAEHVR